MVILLFFTWGRGYGLRKLKRWIGYVADFNWNGYKSFLEIIFNVLLY